MTATRARPRPSRAPIVTESLQGTHGGSPATRPTASIIDGWERGSDGVAVRSRGESELAKSTRTPRFKESLFGLRALLSSSLRDLGDDPEVHYGTRTTTTPESGSSPLGRITNRLRPPLGHTYVVFVSESPLEAGFHPVGAFSRLPSAQKSVVVAEPWKLSQDEFGPRSWLSRVGAAEPRWAGLRVKIYEMAIDEPSKTL